MLTAIILAAGSGKRLHSFFNKQFLYITGQPLLARTLLSLKGKADRYIIVAREGEESLCEDLGKSLLDNVTVVTGGGSRQKSVYSGLKAAKGSKYVLIHDGCRPFAPPDLITRVIDAAAVSGAAIPVVSLTDTIKTINGAHISSTISRETLRAAQTPQVFLWDLLWRAHNYAIKEGIEATDDAALLEKINFPVSVVPGSSNNIKITTAVDLRHLIWPVSRVGFGYDVHKLVKGRNLVLGGVKIPHQLGLEGHSDADVLVHAIIDSLLGAGALGDIGHHFPDTLAAYKDSNSLELLKEVKIILDEKNYSIENIDATISAQEPKLEPYIGKIRNTIASVLDLPLNRVNIKATTTEGLGFVGNREGIAAQVVCLLTGN